ncbi:MAG: hypothetical protein GY845_17940 [Planctomycetes bacterium]|nr:hypothetical protein [Planctomycetota bacterium]
MAKNLCAHITYHMGTVLDDTELREIEQYYTDLEEKALIFSHFLNLAEVSPDLDNDCLSFSIRKDFIENVFYQKFAWRYHCFSAWHGGSTCGVLQCFQTGQRAVIAPVTPSACEKL